MNDKEYVKIGPLGDLIINFVYEPPPPPEFRLYYDDNGNVLFYTGEKPEGNYIVVDKQTFAEARPDVKVINGVIILNSNITQIYKLKPTTEGTLTYVDDVSLILDSTDVEGTYWQFDMKELIRE
jgi:hypothetical protein